MAKKKIKHIKKNICFSLVFILFLLNLFFVSSEILQGEPSNVLTEFPEEMPQTYSFSDEFIGGLFSSIGLVLMGGFLLIAIIPLFFIYYTFKNKKIKIKFVLSLISSIILLLDYIVFVWLWGSCIAGCDGLGEYLVTVTFLLPIAGIVIVPWIIYWTYNKIKK